MTRVLKWRDMPVMPEFTVDSDRERWRDMVLGKYTAVVPTVETYGTFPIIDILRPEDSLKLAVWANIYEDRRKANNRKMQGAFTTVTWDERR